MPSNLIPEDAKPFGDAFMPAASGPDAAAADAAEAAFDALAMAMAPFMSGPEDAFRFHVAQAHERAAHGADWGLGGGEAPAMPPQADGGVALDHAPFAYARPADGSGGGGKPPKDGGDTGGLVSSYTSGGDAKTSYNITITFETGNWTKEVQDIFKAAADYLSSIVLGDISDERVPLFGRVDDLKIEASVIDIDGAGGILGGAGVFASRVGSELPAASIMQFDVADIGAAVADGYFRHVVLHEMLHAMGFGGKWADMGLLATDQNGDLRFTGAYATAEYNKLALAADDPLSHLGVLVETDYGPGTAGVHWDEETFADFLMTGLIDVANPGDPAPSVMTIAALEDMGYDTIYQPPSELIFA